MRSLLQTLSSMNRDVALLFTMRTTRLFAYGFLAVVLVLYLTQAGLSESRIGLLLALTLVGDTLISLAMSTHADRVGRKRMLLLGAALMLLAGAVFLITRRFEIMLAAAIVGVISPSGNEVGPFLAIEQAALSQTIPEERRTQVFAWYNLVGYFATAAGALCGGALAQLLQDGGWSALDSYRAVLAGYAAAGALLALLASRLSAQIEAPRAAAAGTPTRLGLHKSRRVVFKLAALFSLDAFAGGLIMTSVLAYWFHVRYAAGPALLGALFFTTNLLAGFSALFAARIAARFGLINTMVFTHIPSNIMLMLVPFMPTLPLAIAMLLLRSTISQMDVPTRQSYTMAVVAPDERAAAAGVTGVARTAGVAAAPLLAGPLLGVTAYAGLPFLIAGSLKIVYDLLLYRSFRTLRPAGEDPTLATGQPTARA